SFFEKALLSLTRASLVASVVVVGPQPIPLKGDGFRILPAGPLPSSETLSLILSEIRTKYLLLFPGAERILLEPQALERLVGTAESTGAGIVFPDFYEGKESTRTLHPLNDYQAGSVRDDFDFGSMILFSTGAVRNSLEKYGPVPAVKSAGLYDLRLKVSIDYSVHHLREALYALMGENESAGDEKLFAYVDPRQEGAQKEMEAVFTDYLKRIGAYLPPQSFRKVPPAPGPFPVEASVVIPVRNREQTIAEAVKSALSQETDFPFNILVVNNHSTDQTTSVLSDLAGRHSAVKHIIPLRTDLGIGGCWNEALRHEACGRYAVQLDSDDLYSSARTLQKMVDKLRQGDPALVIGSYTLVDSSLRKISPGLIDHREWTDENGRNNALRINGLGAPRAFHSGLMRKIGFLNVSYGEDYAAALCICREYRIGRIYESLYFCRRWSGNTDAALTIEAANRNDAFKDEVRTAEILARQKMNQGR
ncbi:MAG: glycosyltransferase family 2 protein, partial [Deltaproteobacteria bacterium]